MKPKSAALKKLEALQLKEARRLVAKADREAEKRQEAAVKARAEALIGKHFKFYNGGGGDNWWLYVKVVGVASIWKNYGHLIVDSFQAAPNNEHGISVERNCHLNFFGDRGLSDGYIPVSEEEFERETAKILAKLGLKRA